MEFSTLVSLSRTSVSFARAIVMVGAVANVRTRRQDAVVDVPRKPFDPQLRNCNDARTNQVIQNSPNSDPKLENRQLGRNEMTE